MDEGEGIEVREEGDQVRILMPMLPAELWPKSAGVGPRMMQCFLTAMLVAMAAGSWWLTIDMVIKLRRFVPVNNFADLVLIAGILIPTGILMAGAALFTWLLASGYFPRHLEFILDGAELIERYRRGPWVWRRRLKRESISEVLVSAPAKISSVDLAKPIERRQAVVWLVTAKKKQRIACAYPYRIAKALTQELSMWTAQSKSGVEILRPRQRNVGTPVKQMDWLDPAILNADLEEAPAETGLMLKRNERGVVIETAHGIRIRELLRNGTFRAGLWHFVLPLMFYLILPLLPAPLVANNASTILIGASIAGLLWMGEFVWQQLTWRVYEITTPFFEMRVHNAFFRRHRRWSREDIAAIRIVQCLGKEQRCRTVLELLQKDGHREELGQGAVPDLRYLGTVLRRDLEVGVDADVPRGSNGSPMAFGGREGAADGLSIYP